MECCGCVGDFFKHLQPKLFCVSESEAVLAHLLRVFSDAPCFAGVGVFPSQDPVQPRMPPWIYNESLVPGKTKHKSLVQFSCCIVYF